MRDLALACHDLAREAVGRTEVGVPGGDHASDQGPVVLVVQELDHLLRHGTFTVASAVRGGDQHVRLLHTQVLLGTAQRDALGREIQPIDKTPCVLRYRGEIHDASHDHAFTYASDMHTCPALSGRGVCYMELRSEERRVW